MGEVRRFSLEKKFSIELVAWEITCGELWDRLFKGKFWFVEEDWFPERKGETGEWGIFMLFEENDCCWGEERDKEPTWLELLDEEKIFEDFIFISSSLFTNFGGTKFSYFLWS